MPRRHLEQLAHGLGKVEAKLHDRPSAWAKHPGGGGDEAAVNGKAIGTREKRGGRLVIANFPRQSGRVREGDIGRVGDQQIETTVREGAEQIGLDEEIGKASCREKE